MPPRPRRAGYRPGHLSSALRQAIAREAQVLADVEGAVPTVVAVGDVFASLDDALAEVALQRTSVPACRRPGLLGDRGLGVAVDQWLGHHADPSSTWATAGGAGLFLATTIIGPTPPWVCSGAFSGPPVEENERSQS